MANIATLRVMLAGDDAELRSALGRSDKATKKWAKKQQSYARMAERALKGAATGMVAYAAATKRAIDVADQLGKTAAKLGLAVESLDAYRFAAERAGMTTRQFDNSIQRFTRRIGEAARGEGVLKDTFKELNIELRDTNGNMRTTEAIMRDYADAIQRAESPQERLRLAFKAFDKEGSLMVNMLGKGAEGLDSMTKAATELGVVMETGVTQKAAVMSDKIGTITDQIMTQVNSTLVNVAYDAMLAYDDLVRATSLAFGVKIPQMFAKFRIALAENITKGFANAGISSIKGMRKLINSVVNMRDYAPEWVREFFGWEEGSADSSFGSSFIARFEKDIEIADQRIADLTKKLAQYQQIESMMLQSRNQSRAGEAAALGTVNAVGPADPSTGTTPGVGYDPENDPLIKGMKAYNELQEKVAMWEGKVKQSRMDNIQTGINLMGQFAKKGSALAKVTIAVQTALNIAQILMNTEAAKMRAIAELGPIAGPAMAIKIGAMGKLSAGLAAAAGAAALGGQFHDGIDSVPSTGSYLLESGERVIDKRTNRDLKDALKSGGMNGGSNMPATLNFNVTGVEDPEVINKVIQQNRGDFEAMLRQINADRAGAGLI